VIFMEEKRIQCYESYQVGRGIEQLRIIVMYLKDADIEQKHGNFNEWELVPCREDVPQQKKWI
jgi:hypothetical protein